MRKSPPSTPPVIVRKKRPASPSASTPAPAASVKKSPVKPAQAQASPPIQAQTPPVEPIQPIPAPSGPNYRQRQRQARDELLTVLRERWPQTFPTDFRLVRPFALGIHHEIVQALPETNPPLIRRAIAFYQRGGHGSYFRSVLQGGPRYSLDGTATGEVTEQEKALATQELLGMKARWEAKRAGRREEGKQG